MDRNDKSVATARRLNIYLLSGLLSQDHTRLPRCWDFQAVSPIQIDWAEKSTECGVLRRTTAKNLR